jgi:hypothetical protein
VAWRILRNGGLAAGLAGRGPGGGYDERERRVSPDTRAEVFRWAGGCCENCGRRLDFDRSALDLDAVATIQHVEGNWNDFANLKAFCRRCNNADARAKFRPVTPGSPEAKMAAELKGGWSSPQPIRLCDDDERWSGIWQQLARSARQVLQRDRDLDGVGGDEDLPGFRGWTQQGTPIQEFQTTPPREGLGGSLGYRCLGVSPVAAPHQPTDDGQKHRPANGDEHVPPCAQATAPRRAGHRDVGGVAVGQGVT